MYIFIFKTRLYLAVGDINCMYGKSVQKVLYSTYSTIIGRNHGVLLSVTVCYCLLLDALTGTHFPQQFLQLSTQ